MKDAYGEKSKVDRHTPAPRLILPTTYRTDQPSSRLDSSQLSRDWNCQHIVSFAPRTVSKAPAPFTPFSHCRKITLVCKQQPSYTGRTGINGIRSAYDERRLKR
jgi:hypothetical protein